MKTYRTAVVGLGKIGLLYDLEPQRPHPSTHVFAYEENPAFQVVCGIDGDPSKKEYLKKASPGALFFADLEAAGKHGALDDIDVVSVCTPPAAHLETLRFLLERDIGRILFCEKPLVGNTQEADELRRLMEQNPGKLLIPNISRRWNPGLRRVTACLQDGEYGKLRKIHVRYTRGIFNTGTHLLDLLKMWTGVPVKRVWTAADTDTSAAPEKTYSFWFEQKDGVTGYAEAVDDRGYYLFEMDLYLADGKIEMRNSGDDILYYGTGKHHLFEGFRELCLLRHDAALLSDPCFRGAVKNLEHCLQGREEAFCGMEDALYPLYVAEALERSYHTKNTEEIRYE